MIRSYNNVFLFHYGFILIADQIKEKNILLSLFSIIF